MREAASALLADPESLRRDPEATIERKREACGGPERETRARAAALSEVERNGLEETRGVARRELAPLVSENESLEVFERDRIGSCSPIPRSPRGPSPS